jgi:hypothetical protein
VKTFGIIGLSFHENQCITVKWAAKIMAVRKTPQMRAVATRFMSGMVPHFIAAQGHTLEF